MDDLVTVQPALYLGVVSSKQKSFGFIRSQLPADTFFHKFSCADDLFDSLKVGDAVSFQLEPPSSKPGKRVAASVSRSSQQPVLETVDPTIQYGRVVRPTATSQTHSKSGILRYIPASGKVQHLTYQSADMAVGVSAEQLQAGHIVSFKVLTDVRQQQLLEASGKSNSPHAVHAYQRATHVTPVPPQSMVRALH